MKYKEYPNIRIPHYLESWKDTSWHNDVTASSTYDLPFDHSIVVWVSHDNPDEREDKNMPKFLIWLCNPVGDQILSFSTDSESFMEMIVNLIMKGYRDAG